VVGRLVVGTGGSYGMRKGADLERLQIIIVEQLKLLLVIIKYTFK